MGRKLPRRSLEITNDVSIPLIREAGRFKITYDMSLADTFVCAAASLLSATVVTADGEMLPIDELDFFYFRPPKEKKNKLKPDVQTISAERDQAIQALAEANRRIALLEAR